MTLRLHAPSAPARAGRVPTGRMPASHSATCVRRLLAHHLRLLPRVAGRPLFGKQRVAEGPERFFKEPAALRSRSGHPFGLRPPVKGSAAATPGASAGPLDMFRGRARHLNDTLDRLYAASHRGVIADEPSASEFGQELQRSESSSHRGSVELATHDIPVVEASCLSVPSSSCRPMRP